MSQPIHNLHSRQREFSEESNGQRKCFGFDLFGIINLTFYQATRTKMLTPNNDSKLHECIVVDIELHFKLSQCFLQRKSKAPISDDSH